MFQHTQTIVRGKSNVLLYQGFKVKIPRYIFTQAVY